MPIHTYPTQLLSDNSLLPTWMEFKVFKRTSLKNSTEHETVNLYMPDDLSMPSSVQWGNDKPMGIAGAALQARRGQGTGVGEVMVAGAIDSVKNRISDYISGEAKNAGYSYDAQHTADVASVGAGMVQNPYLTAIFDGVNFRESQFRFKLVPHSESDCEVIDNIIKVFRGNSLPEKGNIPGMLNYPSEFQIRYVFENKDHPYLKKFMRSVITKVDVQYGSGDQWTQYRNGFPTAIALTLQFKEIQVVFSEHVLNEGY